MSDKKQQEMKEEIGTFMRKKDYYQILGVTKSASDSQIKKAYRTLALRFHPDKNQTQGSKEVFKKVSNSYATLIDPQKRKHYDQFGLQEERPRPQYHHHHRHQGQDEEFYQFDDIFQAFFGGVPRHRRQGAQHFRAYQFNNFNRPQQQQQQQGFNIYYIFVVLFVIYTILPLFHSSPNFSLSPTYEHRIKRTTSKLNVEYYINQKFIQEARSRDFLRKAEMQMDKEYLLQLQQKCEFMKNQKRNLETYAYSYSEGRQRQSYLSRARNVDMTPCRYLNQISINFEEYVRELTYMKF